MQERGKFHSGELMDADCYLKDMHGTPIGNVSTNPIYVLAGTKALADGKVVMGRGCQRCGKIKT